MTKTEAIKVLEQLEPTEKVRLIIDAKGIGVNSTQKASAHLFWLQNSFCSPWKKIEHKMSDGSTWETQYVLDANRKNIELDCIQLVGSNFDTTKMDSFDFACWYNDITNPSIEPKEVEYTKEQQYELQDFQNQIEQTEFYN